MESSNSTPPETPADTAVTPPSTTPPAPASPSTSDVLTKAFALDVVPRFTHLLEHAKTLIALHGPYDTLPNSTIFTRAQNAPSQENPPSVETFATSLAAAQDSNLTTQPAGPAKSDLQLFRILWDAATDVLDKILEESNLDHEACGWGVIGLSAGYMNPPTTSITDRKNFTTFRDRLRAALKALPSLNSPHSGRGSGVSPDQRVFLLIKARREVHVCSKLLIQQFMKEGWTSVRWYHGVSVAERWVGNLELAQVVTENDERGQEVSESGAWKEG